VTRKVAILAVAAFALSGCLSTSVSTIALCVGLCRYKIEAAPAPTAAEKLGAGLGGIAAEFFAKPKR
jgi:hypothetical protein